MQMAISERDPELRRKRGKEARRGVAILTVCLGALLLAAWLPAGVCAQGAGKVALSRRISYEEARQLLTGEEEGNIARQPNRFTRTKLRGGQVIELYYPLKTQPAGGQAKPLTVAGYGILYASEAAYREATRPRHMLEDLIPDGRAFVDQIPQLLARLEKRLGLRPGRLEYTRAGLRRIDAFLRNYHDGHTTAQTDPRLFQELTACYGEALRRARNGEWHIREEKVGATHRQAEPNLMIDGREIKPWSSVINVLYDEEKRGTGLTRSFDADLGGVRR